MKIKVDKETLTAFVLTDNDDNWIPISYNIFPEDNVSVQVTYKGIDTDRVFNGMAFIINGKWFWDFDLSEAKVKIIAWKPLCKPYVENKHEHITVIKYNI